ncbi:MAG: ComEC/Rec2 family competence protein [Jannaschia sp.]
MHQAEVTPHRLRDIGDGLVLGCQGLRGRRLPWLAVAFGTGAGLYFALKTEPAFSQVVALCFVLASLLIVARLMWQGIGVLPLILAALVAGLLAGVVRTAIVSGPVLSFRYYGAVEGRVVEVDRSASGALRITLDHVRLDGLAPDRTPHRVRISLQGEVDARPHPGDWIMTTAHLSAPNGPTEPGGFDFQRHAFYEGLGGIGYARVPILRMAPNESDLALAITRLRDRISEGLRTRMPGPRGEVAAAITTGDRSGLPEAVVEALRVSNLAHLLAISGLHMGLLVGFVFWSTRGGLALWPRVALRYPTRIWAAIVALPFAIFYLFLSGGSVATQRAFIMAVVMLGAIILGRRALSLRSVALAALIVLLWRPESITGPGFQMSFAATGALVVAFAAMTRLRSRDGWSHWFTGWRGAVLSLLVSSIVAGAATAPFAALHFNRVGQFGVLANLLAVPMMGTLVMPMLLVALMLWPLGLGLEALPLWIAGQGIGWIIWVAEMVAALPGAIGYVPTPHPLVLPIIGFGMAILGCATGRSRWAGLAVLSVAGVLWSQSNRPDLLIASDGRLVGAITPEGRWLSRESGAGFAAESWLENDGDGALQAQAAARAGPDPRLPEIIALRGKTGLDEALNRCQTDTLWIVTPVPVDADVGRCEVFDERRLRLTGAVAVRIDRGGGLTVIPATGIQGLRPWTTGWQAGGRRGALRLGS